MNSDQINDLRVTLSVAKSCHEAWWIVDGADDLPLRSELIKVFNRYLNYFGLVQPALFTTFVVKLASTFDTRSDCITLKILPDHHLFSEFSSIWDRGRKLYRYRNKVIAHRDLHVPTRNFAGESGFTYNGLRDLLHDSCALFDFCAQRMSIEPILNLSSKSDLQLMAQDFHTASSA